MGPFQYIRMLVTFIWLGQAIMRNKIFQNCLNLIGDGSNGKSQFTEILQNLFGKKMVYVTAKLIFSSNTSETKQISQINEEAMLIYDVEANDPFDLSSFKTFVTDTLGPLGRKLYSNVIGTIKSLK